MTKAVLVDVSLVTSVLGVAEVHPSVVEAVSRTGANGKEVKEWRMGSHGRANTRVHEMRDAGPSPSNAHMRAM